MTKRWIRSAGLLCTLAALAACEKGPTAPQPGVLTLRLSAPATEQGALLLSLTGPGTITEITAPPGSAHVAHARAAGTTAKVAVFGAIGTGDLVRFSVPDVGQASGYEARLLEVAGPDNSLRSLSDGYSLTVQR